MPKPNNMRIKRKQCANSVLMIRPASFGFNEETAATNTFQLHSDNETVQHCALTEFDAVVQALREAGINVLVVDDTPVPCTPDAIFPNNWISFHEDGTVVLYPMLTTNRRSERRDDIMELIKKDYDIARLIDLDMTEGSKSHLALEGTGSLVLDHISRRAYGGISLRTDPGILQHFSQKLSYDLMSFETDNGLEQSIYHTNVMLSIGEKFAVICLEAIPDSNTQRKVCESLGQEHELIIITLEQMCSFAANILQLNPLVGGQSIIAMSQAACNAFTSQQRHQLEKYANIVSIDISTIEQCGGGSVRCMLAEIRLPRLS